MDKFYESKYHRLEESGWWFISRRDIILKLIKKLNLKKDAKILDIGCSGGPLIKILEQDGFTNVCGIDISPDAIDLCKRRGIEDVAVMDAAKTQFQDNEFDLIISSDVLAHIEDDSTALFEWHRLLKPDGNLIIFTPAFNFLWSAHDALNHHWRRYSKKILLEKLERSGLEISRSSYWNFCIFLPKMASRIFQNFLKKKEDQLRELSPWLNKCLIGLLEAENWMLNFFNIPVGTSVFAVCKKSFQNKINSENNNCMDKQKEIGEKINFLIAEYVAASPKVISRYRVPLSTLIYDEKELQAGIGTILSGWISMGPKVKEFEKMFAEYIGVKHAIAVNSGSSANLLALNAAIEAGDLSPGDEVIVPATTFSTVASPIIQLGCVPVYVDVASETFNISPEAIEVAISPKTKWIMPVHTLGLPADMPRIKEIADRHNLKILEDCCEAHGSSINNKKTGSFGNIATFSFFIAHNMTTGEGGMIVTNDDNYAKICRSLREFGRIDQSNISGDRFYSDGILNDYDKKYVFDRLGYNVRMTDIAAVFGIEQLKKLDQLNAARIKNAEYYSRGFAKYSKYLRVTQPIPQYVHTYYTYPLVILPEAGIKRIDFLNYLEKRGIETRPVFAGSLPDQPAFRNAKKRVVGDLANASFIRDCGLFFGVHPALAEADLEHVIQTIDGFFADRKLV